MKFVALVSGGKDSMYNIMHCMKNGHELTAIANLHPPQTSESDEMDSFMFQTVGFKALSRYGECLNVPLYRAEILGSSLNQSLDYSPGSGQDETEDMYQLLAKIKQAHSIEAVSVGAILSTYQRTRVESVCQRLGLTCLAYLWQRDQAELLNEICDSGVDARIIKTAGAGLGKRHLGKSLTELKDELYELNKKFGLFLCGEGGEYETLVLDAPIMRKQLKIDPQSIHIIEDQDCVSHLSNIGVELIEKESYEKIPNVAIPQLLDETHGDILTQLRDFKVEQDIGGLSCPEVAIPNLSVSETKERLFIANVTAPSSSLEEETAKVFELLESTLSKYKLTSDHIVSISLLVKDMSQFQRINTIYSKYFTKPNPPSRMCIQTAQSTQLQLSAMVVKNLAQRQGLHVQGRSYWAPANIGPYAQSIQCEETTTLAGQIGLIPASLELHPDKLTQIALSLQHIRRVQQAQNSLQFAYTVAFTTEVSLVPLIIKAWGSSKPLLVAVVEALPRAASVEWTGAAINERFISILPDEDEVDDELFDTWVYPAKAKVDGFEYGLYGTLTLAGSLDQIEDRVSGLNVSSATIYTTSAQSSTVNAEIIYVNALFDKTGAPVSAAAVINYRLL